MAASNAGLLWQYATGSSVASSPAVPSGPASVPLVYVGSEDGSVYAFGLNGGMASTAGAASR